MEKMSHGVLRDKMTKMSIKICQILLFLDKMSEQSYRGSLKNICSKKPGKFPGKHALYILFFANFPGNNFTSNVILQLFQTFRTGLHVKN